jgi:protein transport protein SEC20
MQFSFDEARARASFRKLLLQAIKTLKEARHTQASKHLFVPIQPVAPQARISTDSKPRHDISPTSATQDTIALTAATDVTLALKRTHQLLEQELEKSTISLETLDHSSQTLRQLEQQYSAFDVLLKGSKRLITELERADYWDRWLIYISLTIFGLTCLWITYKRILRGPLGLMIWVGRKAFSASGSGQPVSLTKAVSVTKSLTSSITQEAIEAVSTALLSSRDEL